MEKPEAPPQPEPYSCPARAHVFEWNSAVHEQCPGAQRCLCGARSYSEALLQWLRQRT